MIFYNCNIAMYYFLLWWGFYIVNYTAKAITFLCDKMLQMKENRIWWYRNKLLEAINVEINEKCVYRYDDY